MGRNDALPGRLGSKTCGAVEVKSEERGEVRAVVATMGVRDKDGDLILPGAFGRQDVLVSAYNHTTWQGALPVGRGVVFEQGTEAIADLKFFLDDEDGRRHFRLIKNVGAAQEFSFGFDVEDWVEPNEEQRRAGVKRVIRKFKVYEVSPVFRGAGVNTRVLAAKTELEMEAEMIGLMISAIDNFHEANATLDRVERRERSRKAVAQLPPRALRAAFGDLARVHVRRKGWPPFDGIPNQHVVITTGGKVYRRSIHAPSEWTEIR